MLRESFCCFMEGDCVVHLLHIFSSGKARCGRAVEGHINQGFEGGIELVESILEYAIGRSCGSDWVAWSNSCSGKSVIKGFAIFFSIDRLFFSFFRNSSSVFQKNYCLVVSDL